MIEREGQVSDSADPADTKPVTDNGLPISMRRLPRRQIRIPVRVTVRTQVRYRIQRSVIFRRLGR